MKISTEIASAARFIGEEKTIELVAKSGFDAWDFSMFEMVKYDWGNKTYIKSEHPLAGSGYLKFARKLAHIAKECGIECSQSHAPFPCFTPDIISYLKRSIECTAEAGGKICVIHPNNYRSAKENAEMFLEILPFAKECGIKIATENMWCWDDAKDQVSFAACMTPADFNAHLDAVNDESFVACLDIGHSEMRGTGTSAVKMIKALGKRLGTLHIHDNDQWHDSHQLPFTMKIDFQAIVDALWEIGYSGYFTLEADKYLRSRDDGDIEAGIKAMADTTRRLADMFEAKGTKQ